MQQRIVGTVAWCLWRDHTNCWRDHILFLHHDTICLVVNLLSSDANFGSVTSWKVFILVISRHERKTSWLSYTSTIFIYISTKKIMIKRCFNVLTTLTATNESFNNFWTTVPTPNESLDYIRIYLHWKKKLLYKFGLSLRSPACWRLTFSMSQVTMVTKNDKTFFAVGEFWWYREIHWPHATYYRSCK